MTRGRLTLYPSFTRKDLALVTFGHIFTIYHMSILTQLPEKQGFSWIPLAEIVSFRRWNGNVTA